MSLLLALLAAGSLEGRAVSLAADVVAGTRPLHLDCPAGQSTRIILPQADLGVKVSPGAKEKLGLRRIASRPETIILLAPPKHPAKGTLELTGPGIDILIAAETTERGGSSVIRLTLASPPPSPPEPRPTPLPAATAAPHSSAPKEAAGPPTLVPPPAIGIKASPSVASPPAVVKNPSPPTGKGSPPPLVDPSPTPASAAPVETNTASSPPPSGVPSPAEEVVFEESSSDAAPSAPPTASALPAFDTSGVLSGQWVRIGRREGQPGRLEMELQDAVRGDHWVWLRFVLARGAGEQVSEVSWHRESSSAFAVYKQETRGKDLLVVVQLPREELTKKTRVTLKVADGVYRFAVSSPTFASFLKSLF